VKVRFFGLSDQGRRREANEDAFFASEADGFCLVADGMGGHDSGEVASGMAVQFFGDRLGRTVPWRARVKPGRETLREAFVRLVRDWVQAANAAIYERGGRHTAASGRRMGTTLALLCVVDDFVVCAHVGDSRIYRLRGVRLERLTRDHSVAGADVEPLLPPGRVRKKKYITRALGTRPDVEPEVRVHELRAGDRFVLCSDGLTDHVTDAEITQSLIEAGDDPDSLRDAPRALVNLANERGGRDNITVVIATVDDFEDLPPPPLEPPPKDEA